MVIKLVRNWTKLWKWRHFAHSLTRYACVLLWKLSINVISFFQHSCRNLNAELLSSTLASFVFRFLLLSAPDSKQLFLHEAQYLMQKLTSQAGYGWQKLIILQKYFEAYLCRLPNHTIIRENRNCTCHFGWGHASQVLIFARQVECMLLVEAPKQNGVCIISHKYLLLA